MKSKGKIIEQKGKFFVQIGTKKHELVPNALGGVDTFKGLVGQEVQAVLSEPELVAIITKPVKPPAICFFRCFICYVPADPWRIWQISELVRKDLLQSFVKEGLVDEALAARAAGGR